MPMDHRQKLNLLARCQEILDWKRTGILNQDGALKQLANSLTEMPPLYRLQIAEHKTNDEALQFVIDNAIN